MLLNTLLAIYVVFCILIIVVCTIISYIRQPPCHADECFLNVLALVFIGPLYLGALVFLGNLSYRLYISE
jgi:predicted membrane protein